MELRTRIDIGKSNEKISHSDPVLFIGSCFASETGSRLASGKMPVLINPAGTVYNPVSVINTLNLIFSGKQLRKEDLYCHEGTWLSFSHYTDFSSEDPVKVIDKINRNSDNAHSFLQKARFLFVTFGTARVFRLKETGTIVSNCHKLPSSFFVRELLKTQDIVNQWSTQLELLATKFPKLKVIFTISPIRHWKDGAHGNQVSKSVLFLAVEELLGHSSSPGYFPAYEILMDELRDYRFYDEDMLHPSKVAVDYIWEKFMDCYFEEPTVRTWKEASKITHAMRHRVTSENAGSIKKFAENMLSRIHTMEATTGIDFTNEKNYFQSLIK
jgi:hypothetical protein